MLGEVAQVRGCCCHLPGAGPGLPGGLEDAEGPGGRTSPEEGRPLRVCELPGEGVSPVLDAAVSPGSFAG